MVHVKCSRMAGMYSVFKKIMWQSGHPGVSKPQSGLCGQESMVFGALLAGQVS